MTPCLSTLLVDCFVLGTNAKGVGRVNAALGPRLFGLDPERVRLATTASGISELAGSVPATAIVRVPDVPRSVWEQVLLPAVALRQHAGAVYSFQEAGALWGPPLLLHVPEDPEVRFAREPVRGTREALRRAYSRAVMDRSLRRNHVAVCSRTTARDLAANHGIAEEACELIPLAVDLERFVPAPDAPGRRPWFFHLTSSDERDLTDLVIRAYAGSGTDLPLHVGGELGARGERLRRLARDLGVEDRVSFTGRLSDADLVAEYQGAQAMVHATSDEGFGLQPLEAMACGAHVISTTSPTFKEIAGGAAVTWCPCDPDALGAAIAEVAGGSGLRERARRVNRRVAERWSWDSVARSVYARLVEIADGDGDAPGTSRYSEPDR